jgi:hypothetical protein
MIAAVVRANQRKADRVIAAYLARNSGMLTDDLERGIERSDL